MWLMSYITNNSISSPNAVKGELSAGGAVSSSGEHKGVEMCFPYGLVSIPPAGERAVVLPLDDGEVGLGVLKKAVGLEAGELMLYSKGGATLVLKNDGRVLINGREPVNSIEPINDGEPVNDVEPTDDGEPTDGVEPINDGEPANGVEPINDGEPVNSVEPTDDGEPTNGGELGND